MSRPHEDLINSIRLFLSEQGAMSTVIDTPGLVHSKNGTPFIAGTKGALDIAVTLKGRAIWIDAKTGRDRLKPAQAKFCAAQERAGGIAFAAWSVDDVKDRLTKEGLI